jgi:hypothetical protein
MYRIFKSLSINISILKNNVFKTKLFSTSTSTSTSTSSSLWSAYNTALEKRPLLVKSITAGVLSFSADLVSQVCFPNTLDNNNNNNNNKIDNNSNNNEIDKNNKIDNKNNELIKNNKFQIDYQRLMTFTILGSVLVGPTLHFW